MSNLREIIEREMAAGPVKTVADRLESALQSYIRHGILIKRLETNDLRAQTVLRSLEANLIGQPSYLRQPEPPEAA